MTAFADSAALFKLYVPEAGTSAMLELAATVPMSVSALAYVEVRSGLARLSRERTRGPAELAGARVRLDAHWSQLAHIELDAAVVRVASALCDRHPLRAGDALQLASACRLRDEGSTVTFVSSDGRLLIAAAAEGLATFNPEASATSAGDHP